MKSSQPSLVVTDVVRNRGGTLKARPTFAVTVDSMTQNERCCAICLASRTEHSQTLRNDVRNFHSTRNDAHDFP